MLPFTTATLGHASDAAGGAHRARDTASSPAFLAFVILLAALFLVCLCSAAARRLYARFFGSFSGANTRPSPLTARRCLGSLPHVDPAEVAGSLPVRAYAGGVGDGEVCAVCLGELRAEEQVKAIPACGHVFHAPCIDRWLDERNSCPVCRCAVVCFYADSVGRDVGSDGDDQEVVLERVVAMIAAIREEEAEARRAPATARAGG